MNYLAHAYLSFNDPEILVGNMISDFIKGKKRFDFTHHIQNGIMLHRSIDTFTDEHIVTKQAKQFLKPVVGLYAGAFIDIVYDHFLANDENEFDDNSLLNFSSSVYTSLEDHKNILPEKFAGILPYMRSENWLYNYKTMNGIAKSFGGLMRRAKFLENNNLPFECFQKNYNELKFYYHIFFPDVKQFAHEKFIALTEN
jgi:acyl carrier protein phosphodiesterase